jgi:hypothetical protein
MVFATADLAGPPVEGDWEALAAVLQGSTVSRRANMAPRRTICERVSLADGKYRV